MVYTFTPGVAKKQGSLERVFQSDPLPEGYLEEMARDYSALRMPIHAERLVEPD